MLFTDELLKGLLLENTKAIDMDYRTTDTKAIDMDYRTTDTKAIVHGLHDTKADACTTQYLPLMT